MLTTPNLRLQLFFLLSSHFSLSMVMVSFYLMARWAIIVIGSEHYDTLQTSARSLTPANSQFWWLISGEKSLLAAARSLMHGTLPWDYAKQAFAIEREP
jgi:hypothetical protein